MKQYILDAAYMTDRKEAHSYIARELGFPAYYGHNLDALYDLLTQPGEPATIILKNSNLLSSQLGETYGSLLLQVLKDSAKENDCLDFSIT